MGIYQHPANEARAERAKIALMAYHKEVNFSSSDEFDTESTLTDLLTDLHHYADSEKLQFYERYARSDDCYKEEIADPDL
jgi:hypothetical protein